MDFTVQIDVSGPRRGPNTGKVMHRDYSNFYKNLPGPEVEDVLTSGLTPIREILARNNFLIKEHKRLSCSKDTTLYFM